MRRLLFLLPMMVMFVGVQAQNITNVALSYGVKLTTNPAYSTRMAIDLTVITDAETRFVDFSVQMIYFPLTGQPEVVKETNFTSLYKLDPGELSWKFNLEGYLAAGKSQGKVGLRIVRKNADNTTNFENSVTQYTLIDNYTKPPGWINNPFQSFIKPNGDKYSIHTLSSYLTPPVPGSQGVFFPSNTPVLTSGQAMYSPNGQYFFTLQQDGSLVLYKTSNSQILWSADTYQKGGKYLFFAPDGNLILSKNPDASGVVWASNIYVSNANFVLNPRPYYVVQDDGNFVMYWNGGIFTDSMGDTGTSGGQKSSHFREIK